MIQHIWLLAKRDFLQRARSKAFLVMMGLTVAAIMAIGPVVNLIDDPPDAIKIGISGSEPTGIDEALGAVAESLEREIDIARLDSLEEAESALFDEEIDVLIVDGTELVWLGEPGRTSEAITTNALTAVARQRAIDDLGLSGAEATGLLAPDQPSVRSLEPEDPERGAKIGIAYVMIILLYMSILIFGQFVLMGVMEEKSSRVVEVVLSRAEPEEVLAGKVLGIGLLGLTQLLAMILAGLVTLQFVDQAPDLPDIGPAVVTTAVLWFILGFGLYAVLYAGLGATITRQEDVQGAAILPAILIIPAYFIALISIETPDTLLARIGSMAPPTAPIVMPMRAAVSDVPWYETFIAVALLILTIMLLIKVAARVYRGAVLKIGAKVSLREAWRTSED